MQVLFPESSSGNYTMANHSPHLVRSTQRHLQFLACLALRQTCVYVTTINNQLLKEG